MRTVLYVTARILPVSAHPTRWGQRTAYGELTATELKLPVEAYDPQEHYNNVENKWIGLGDENGPETPKALSLGESK
jgi:hypothetical protein